MRIVTVLWGDSHSDPLENSLIPRLLHHYELRIGSFPIDVVILNSFDCIDDTRRKEAQARGALFHDASQITKELLREFSPLGRFGKFEHYCFIRWLALARLFGGDSILHLDGDVVLNVSPSRFLSSLSSMNFVLQGCPGFAVISDSCWFDHYREELLLFARDIDGYSRQAETKRNDWHSGYRIKGVAECIRTPLGSDQDLISQLAYEGIVPQASNDEVMRALSSFVVFENPLELDRYCPTMPVRYERVQGEDRFNDLPILLWHLQSDFTAYLRYHFATESLPLLWWTLGRLPSPLDAPSPKRRLLEQFLRYRRIPFSKSMIFDRYFATGDFFGVLDADHWWKPGVFFP